jgi:hypothetical protein
MSSAHLFSGFAARLQPWLACPAPPLNDLQFDALARELFGLQFAHNEPYRRWCEACGATPAQVAHWTDVPAAPTAAFKELDLSCLPRAARTAVFHSSGTTGPRFSRHYHNADSLALYEASLLPWFRAKVLLRPSPLAGCDLAILTPPRPQAPHSSLVHMFDTVRRELEAPPAAFLGEVSISGAWALPAAAAIAALEHRCRANRPVLLLGTASLFVRLLDGLAERSLSLALPPGSRAIETGGYKGHSRRLPPAELHALISQRLGLPPALIIREYGMTELSSQAYDSAGAGAAAPLGVPPAGGSVQLPPRDTAGPLVSPGEGAHTANHCLKAERQTPRPFHFPPWARAQVVSPETGRPVADGQTGLLRLFDLANVYSVMAIQTEDLAARRGDGFDLLGRAASVEPRGCSLMTLPGNE